jgi:hypothetical protein
VAEEVLTPQIKSFLREYVGSLEHLEILLLLCGKPDRKWTVSEVYDVIKSSQASVSEILAYWRNAGFITEHSPDTFQYNPASEELRAMSAQVAAVYKTHRIRVIEFIYSAPLGPLTEFSRAFRLRKDK